MNVGINIGNQPVEVVASTTTIPNVGNASINI